jgi:hypothetical protein
LQYQKYIYGSHLLWAFRLANTFQMRASPFLTVTIVAATKRSRPFGVQQFPSLIQGLEPFVHLFRNYFNHRAEVNFVRLRIPRHSWSLYLQKCFLFM